MWIIIEMWTDDDVAGFGSIITLSAAVFDGENEGAGNFTGWAAPIVKTFDPVKLAAAQVTRSEHESRMPASQMIKAFVDWTESKRIDPATPIVVVSSNAAQVWAYLEYYFRLFGIPNPFMRVLDISDVFAGTVRNLNALNGWRRWMPKGAYATPNDTVNGLRSTLVKFSDRTGLKLPGYSPSTSNIIAITKNSDGVTPDSDPEPE